MEQIGRYLRRVRAVVAGGGVQGLLRLLYHRFVHRRWRSIVYRDNASLDRASENWPEGYRFEITPPLAEMTEAHKASITAAVGDYLFSTLDATDRVRIVWHGGTAAASGAIMYGNPLPGFLGLPSSTVVMGYFHTAPEHRRRGLFRRAINETVLRLREEGRREILVEVHPDNNASIGGIESAAFERLAVIDASIWCGRLFRRDGKWHWLKGGG